MESKMTMFAASDGWRESQCTYFVALAHVPMDKGLQRSTVASTNPVAQHPRLASLNPCGPGEVAIEAVPWCVDVKDRNLEITVPL